jgi:hypothetical protein
VYRIRGNPQIRHVEVLQQVYKELHPRCNRLFQHLQSVSAQVHCPASVLFGYRLRGNSVTDSVIFFFTRRGLCVGHFVLYYDTWFSFSRYIIGQNSRIHMECWKPKCTAWKSYDLVKIVFECLVSRKWIFGVKLFEENGTVVGFSVSAVITHCLWHSGHPQKIK